MPEAPVLERIKGVFDSREELVKALTELKAAHMDDYEAYGPTNLEELDHLMPRKGSSVRFFATSSGIIGLGLFFYMCVATSLIYNLILGGKHPWSNVPYLIPTYEGTILLGAFGAFGAVLLYAGLLMQKPEPGYDKRFSGDSYGVVVYHAPGRRDEALKILENAGAVVINGEEEERPDLIQSHRKWLAWLMIGFGIMLGGPVVLVTVQGLVGLWKHFGGDDHAD